VKGIVVAVSHRDDGNSEIQIRKDRTSSVRAPIQYTPACSLIVVVLTVSRISKKRNTVCPSAHLRLVSQRFIQDTEEDPNSKILILFSSSLVLLNDGSPKFFTTLPY
jgi:hypothetical protein